MYRGLEIKVSAIIIYSDSQALEEVILTEGDILKLAEEKIVTSYAGAPPKCYPMIEEVSENG